MNPKPDLANLLRQLRLTGILHSLEARNRQAIQSKMAYTDFLGLLICDEVASRDQRRFDLRHRRAGFPSGKTIEQFDFDFNPRINAALIHDLIAERYERVNTLVTSNLDFTEWGDAFPNKLLGAATLDRLRHGAYRLTLDGKSYRSPRDVDGFDRHGNPDLKAQNDSS